MRKRFLILSFLLLLNVTAWAQKNRKPETSPTKLVTPTIHDLLKISRVGWATAISPDGRFIAYGLNKPDFDRDVDLGQILIAEVQTGKTYPLTKWEDGFYNIQWSPDGKGLTYLSARLNQVFYIPLGGGKPVQVTKAPNGVGYFAWSPDGKRLAYTSNDGEPAHLTKRKSKSGNFAVVGERSSSNCLWMIDLANDLNEPDSAAQLTNDISISGFMAPFSWSPDGSKIAFSGVGANEGTDDPSNIYVLNLLDGKIAQVVSQQGRDRDPEWSPDGKQIIFTSDMGKKGLDAYNYRLAVVKVDGGSGGPRSVTDHFDENPRLVEWNKNGIIFWAVQKTVSHVFMLNPLTLHISRIPTPEDLHVGGFSFSHDGGKMAFTASSAVTIDEVYSYDLGESSIDKLTDMTAQIAGFTLGRREVITWKNKEDALEIEGILTKPADFDPNKKYPLLLVIHGGPSETNYPVLLRWRYYPVDVWTSRGALVLEVNYRGSSGYGSKFRKSAFRSFLMEAVDIMSGVDHLIDKGWVDTGKIGCMGWSHGGYLTALLASTNNRFRAVSVGAGVSNWASYYYNSPNGAELGSSYLGDNPSNDPDIYRVVSPISYIKQYQTPTLIQHGETDRLVPVSEAYQFRKALKSRGVKVEMLLYSGSGHGINKPRSLRAATEHNYYWFNHFLWGDALPAFEN